MLAVMVVDLAAEAEVVVHLVAHGVVQAAVQAVVVNRKEGRPKLSVLI